MARSTSPLYGRDAVVVVDADEFNRLKGKRTGELLIEALQAPPHRQMEHRVRPMFASWPSGIGST
ncbi:hypothetical protein [Variovorax sp. JS1663]|uniref:hypothetical protein n=1 Tax=Variovorax sp. JS1663 TaxID=1851577 RepID=UPI000B64648A|nr:hypothetical protein [Variovorax sp. JS1663]OUM03954.1 hypothetical protein A8M77_02760 [Variovorax sp. JS1663]